MRANESDAPIKFYEPNQVLKMQSPLAPFCLDEQQEILSWLPAPERRCVTSVCQALEDRFFNFTLPQATHWPIRKEACYGTVKSLLSSLDLADTTKHFLLRVVVSGLRKTYWPLDPTNQWIAACRFEDIASDWLSNRSQEPSIVRLIRHFPTIEQVAVACTWNQPLAFVLQCLPRLKTIVLVQDQELTCVPVPDHCATWIRKDLSRVVVVVAATKSRHGHIPLHNSKGCIDFDGVTDQLCIEALLSVDLELDLVSLRPMYTRQELFAILQTLQHFRFSATTWKALCRSPNRDMFEYIVQQVHQGKVNHECQYKEDQPLLSMETIADLLADKQGVNALERVVTSGLMKGFYPAVDWKKQPCARWMLFHFLKLGVSLLSPVQWFDLERDIFVTIPEQRATMQTLVINLIWDLILHDTMITHLLSSSNVVCKMFDLHVPSFGISDRRKKLQLSIQRHRLAWKTIMLRMDHQKKDTTLHAMDLMLPGTKMLLEEETTKGTCSQRYKLKTKARQGNQK